MDDFQVLIYHYVYVDELFASGDLSGVTELDRYTVFEEKGDLEFSITLEGLHGNYKITTYRMDRQHGSVFDQWVLMGAPQNPNEEEIQYLHHQSVPTVSIEAILDVSTFSRTVILPPHGVQMLKIKRQF